MIRALPDMILAPCQPAFSKPAPGCSLRVRLLQGRWPRDNFHAASLFWMLTAQLMQLWGIPSCLACGPRNICGIP